MESQRVHVAWRWEFCGGTLQLSFRLIFIIHVYCESSVYYYLESGHVFFQMLFATRFDWAFQSGFVRRATGYLCDKELYRRLVKETVLVWHLIAFGGLRCSQMGGNDLGF